MCMGVHSAECDIRSWFFPFKVKLTDPEDKKSREQPTRTTVSENLIPEVESSFLWLPNIEVSHYHTNDVKVTRPTLSNKT